MEPKGSFLHSQEFATYPYLVPDQFSHISPSHFVRIYFDISHLCLGRPSGLIAQDLSTKTLFAPHLPPIRATCPAFLILLYEVTQIVFCEA